MKGLIQYALEHRPVVYFVTLLLFIGGGVSFFALPQLEDPNFTVKTAVIITKYPGASPKEVEMEVTDRLETAIQEMSQVKHIYSISRAGESYVKVTIKPQYWSDRLPQVWDELRKKIRDVAPKLPPGVESPKVGDDFGSVYGFLLGITGDGFSYKELEQYAKAIKKELSLIQGVSRVDLWGVQEKVVYLEISDKQLSELNLTAETVLQIFQKQNMVVDAGFVDEGGLRFRIAPTGEFTSPEEIGELILRPASQDVIGNVMQEIKEGDRLSDVARKMEKESTSVIRVKDIARVETGYREPPQTLMRYNGEDALGIQIAGSADANIVDVGERLDEAVRLITPHLPIGIELNRIAWQSVLVDESINSFFINLLEAVIIVLVVLMIPSGLRMGLIIGSNLVITILGTFIFMSLMGISLQRMSLGALIIALGMMVDNSIVVADGVAVYLRQKKGRLEAALLAAKQNAFPLLAATVIAIMAFFPIFASTEDAGEYCRSLFLVVAISLGLSWFVAMFITPLQCVDFLPEPKEGVGDEFDSRFYRSFRSLVQKVIRFRFLTLGVLVALLIASVVGFGFVSQMFFPDSTRPQLMIDFWTGAATQIEEVSADAAAFEKVVRENPSVESISTFVGAGPPRFYLPVDPEKNYPNYAQMIVNFGSYKEIDSFIEEMKPWAEENYPQGMVRFRKYSVGPGDAWKFEARISGPGDADMAELRTLAKEVREIAMTSPFGTDWRTDMMNPVLKVVPEFDQKRGRWSGVNRLDLADATKRAFDGIKVGLYREDDNLLPIILRNVERERRHMLTNIETIQIRPTMETYTIPLSQVVSSVETDWEDPYIIRWNRRRAVSVQGGLVQGATFSQLYDSVIEEIDEIPLPPGYEIYWDGEASSSADAKKSLIPGIIPAVIVILFLLVLVFNAFRPVVIILCTIPFAMIGVSAGLLVFNMPFGFMALLGGMSLAGMMNKNIVVLLDAAALNRKEGMMPFKAIVEAAVSRTRPVLLAAGTTILGVIPLLQDVFWQSMAITIMAGLAFGSLLTLVAVPVFYAIFYKVKKSE